ncbi:MAG: hypothetical protein ACLFWB_07230 [Armatimonadota bacterium]
MKILLAIVILTLIVGAVHAQEGFTDHGVAANVAESRGMVCAENSDGENLAICCALDQSQVGWVMVNNIDTGQSQQSFAPKSAGSSPPFHALLHSNGHFYTGFGKHIVDLDIDTLEWVDHGIPCSTISSYLAFTEAPDGTVWAGGVYRTDLISLDPETGEMKDHGRMDPEEKYVNTLAVDDQGWVYGGIGTARCNICAYNPETGEKRSLIPEEKREHGSGHVHPTTDGACYGAAASQAYRLYNGEATPIDKSEAAPRRDVYDISWGVKTGTFPDGQKIVKYSLPEKYLIVEDPETGERERMEFTYESGGATITSLAAGPDQVVYGSTCHPMHFVRLDTKTTELTDMGAVPQIGGGNMCAIATQGDTVIAGEYAGGRMWAYDPNLPWQPTASRMEEGISAETLVENATCTGGHFSYLDGHDLAFLTGEGDFDVTGTFHIEAPEDGSYWLYIQPFQAQKYARVQMSFDGEELGEPFDARAGGVRPGPVLEFGPFDLKAGEHELTLEILETDGQEPWCSISRVLLSQQRREDLLQPAAPNPVIMGQWKRDICRPRTALAHPDGKHGIIGGFAGYGLVGGGLGIVNLETGEDTLLTADADLLSGHSTITLQALPNGDLVGGTSINAPGGGHPTAEEAEIYILDWETKEIVFHTVPIPDEKSIISILVGPDGLVYGLSATRQFFVFDPEAREVIHTEDWSEYGGVPRHSLHNGPDGNIYSLMGGAIVRITPGEPFEHKQIAEPPVSISAGGALVNGLFVYACNAHLWTYDIPGM